MAQLGPCSAQCPSAAAALCPPVVMGLAGCSSTSSVPSSAQADPIPLFALLHCYFWCGTVWLLALWPINWRSNVPVEKSCKTLFIVTPVSLKPRFKGGWGSVSYLSNGRGSVHSWAHLPSPRITRFSQTTKVCAINERIWPTSYSFIGFGLVYMGRLCQFSLSLFLKWFD